MSYLHGEVLLHPGGQDITQRRAELTTWPNQNHPEQQQRTIWPIRLPLLMFVNLKQKKNVLCLAVYLAALCARDLGLNSALTRQTSA